MAASRIRRSEIIAGVLAKWWHGVPRRVRIVVAAMIVVLAYGTVVHVAQLVSGGLRPYPWAPPWLEVYFTSLTLLDPLAAGLLAARRAPGLYLTIAVFATDAVANGYAVYGLGGAAGIAPVSQAVVTVFAIAAVIAAPAVRPYLGGPAREAGDPLA